LPDADRDFHREWIRSLLERALQRTRLTCEDKKQLVHFELFRRRYLDDPEEYAPWSDVGKAVTTDDGSLIDLDEKHARRYAETAVGHYRAALLEELVEATGSIELAKQELDTLLAMFGRSA
jgi:hypothetical protein